jgi:hypothetical protein
MLGVPSVINQAVKKADLVYISFLCELQGQPDKDLRLSWPFWITHTTLD